MMCCCLILCNRMKSVMSLSLWTLKVWENLLVLSELFLYRMILIGLEVCDDAIRSDFSCHSEFGNINGFFQL